MKSGKRLEQNIKSSATHQSIFNYRLRDNAGGFNQTTNLRFTSSNMCDYFLFNKGKLLCLEAKSHKGQSLPLSCIRDKQISMMKDAVLSDGVYAGIFVLFTDYDLSYYLPIQKVVEFIRKEERKSIPIKYFEEEGIEVKNSIKKVNHSFDIDGLFDKL